MNSITLPRDQSNIIVTTKAEQERTAIAVGKAITKMRKEYEKKIRKLEQEILDSQHNPFI